MDFETLQQSAQKKNDELIQASKDQAKKLWDTISDTVMTKFQDLINNATSPIDPLFLKISSDDEIYNTLIEMLQYDLTDLPVNLNTLQTMPDNKQFILIEIKGTEA